jgi:UDP-glucuronate decarboxylase
MSYHQQNKVRIKIARIFNTFGTRMSPNDGRVISNFITQALQGSDITVYGDGRQTRSFLYVDDLVEALVRLMNTADDVTEPVNIGNPEEISILEIAQMIIQLTGSTSRLVTRELPLDDPTQRKPDISLARKLLNGWGPTVPLEKGLAITIDYFKKIKQ